MFLRYNSKSIIHKEKKIDTLDLIKIKNFYSSKEPIHCEKTNHRLEENIFKSHN